MRGGRLAAALGSTLVLALCAAELGCSRRRPEPDLRKVIDEVLLGIERQDPDAILRHLAERFQSEASADQPSLDHAAVQSLVLEFLLREQSFGARPLDVRIGPPSDTGARRVELETWLGEGIRLADPAAPLPAGAVRYAFDLEFARVDAEWQAVSGRFRRLAGP